MHTCIHASFNLAHLPAQANATEYDMIKLINYIRSEVASGRDPRDEIKLSTNHNKEIKVPWDSEHYLTPVMEDDLYVFFDWNDETTDGSMTLDTLVLAKEDTELQELLSEMQEIALRDPTVQDVLTVPFLKEDRVLQKAKSTSEKGSESNKQIDQTYFESYSFFDIHRDMLADKARTEAYLRALEENKSCLYQGNARVLDVGCGTGILSMFAARSGAKKVFAVDGSPQIATIAHKLCVANGFASNEAGEESNLISVLSSKIEDLEALPDAEKVDVLVSEWMGYALLFESMLDSVLVARDRFLKPGGAILPDMASLYVAAGNEGAGGLNFWRNVYGIDMSVVAETLRRTTRSQAVVRNVDPADLVSEAQKLICLDLATMRAEDQDFTAEFELKGSRESVSKCWTLVIWFNVSFTERFCPLSPQVLPTGPSDPQTHWAQTVLHLPVPLLLASPDSKSKRDSGVAVAIKGRLSMARNSEIHRALDIAMEYRPVWHDGTEGDTVTQLYSMKVENTS